MFTVGGGGRVVVLADQHDAPVTERGELGDDLAAGAHVVGTDPGQTIQFVPTAHVHGGKSVSDQAPQLLGGHVPAQEEAAVGEPDPAQGVRSRGPRAAGAGAGEEHEVVTAGGGLLLHTDQEGVVRMLHVRGEGRGETEDTEQIVARGGEPAGRRIGHVAEAEGRVEHPLPGLRRDRGALLLAAEHQRDRGLRDPGQPGHLGLTRS